MRVGNQYYYTSAKDVEFDLNNGVVDRTTKIKFKYNGSWVDTTVGRIQVYLACGIMVDYDLDKSGIKKLFVSINEKYEPEEAIVVIKNLQDLFFTTVTSYGLSLGMDDFNKSLEYKKQMETAYDEALTKEGVERAKVWDTVINNLVEDWKSSDNNNNPLHVMMKSGARVTDTQIRQMIIAKGLLTKMDGSLACDAVNASLSDGLNTHQYFMTCGPARRGLANNFFIVPASGYFERQLVNVCRDLRITSDDCGATVGMVVPKADSRGRYLVDPETGTTRWSPVSPDEINSLQDYVMVRSPTTCQHNNGLCKVCCGLNPATSKPWWDNVGIGVIAAQTMVEYTTQLALRGKHTSGSVTLANYSKSVDNVLADVIKLVGGVSTTAVKLSDSTVQSPNEFEGTSYEERATKLSDTIHNIYNEHGLPIDRVYIEIVVRAISDIAELPGGIYKLRSKGYYDPNPKIRGIMGTLLHHPSWIKAMEFGHIKQHFQRAITTLEPTLDLPSENLLISGSIK